MKGKTLVVLNPIAGGRDNHRLENTIKKWGESSQRAVKIIKTQGERDQQRIAEAVDDFDPEIVVAAGGDGTVLLCAKLAWKHKLHLGILPCGSANGMATELGISDEPERALRLIDKAGAHQIDVLCFGGDDLSLHISDIGLNAALVSDFEEMGERGFLGYSRALVNRLSKAQPFKASIQTDRENWEGNCYMVALANAKHYGTGAKLNEIGRLEDGLFEVCILKKISTLRLATHALNLWRLDADHLQIIQCKKAMIKTDQKVPFQKDGEPQEKSDTLEIEMLEKSLSIIYDKNRTPSD